MWIEKRGYISQGVEDIVVDYNIGGVYYDIWEYKPWENLFNLK